MADDRKNNKISSLTASCVKSPFSKPPPRNIHTMKGGFPTAGGEGVSNAGTKKDTRRSERTDESNVSKLIKLIPGLSQIKNRFKEFPPRGASHRRNGDTENCSNEDGILIDISPSSRRVISGKLASQKFCRTKGSKQLKKASVNPKVMMFSTSQPGPNISSLNVKVSGPMCRVIDEMIECNMKNVVTLSGAGMSTSAGIPDFRSPNSGIYDKLKEYDLPYAQAIFEKKYFDKNPKPLFALLREMLAKDYKPTVAHYFVKLLEEKGLLLRHITQNVDGLERLAGVSQNKVIEAHGSVYGSRCLKCKKEYDLQWLRDRLVIQGKTVPQCQDPRCLGVVKPNVVLFGEVLNPRFIASVKKDIPKCDLLVVIGTSLVVEPFASTVRKVSSSCLRIVVNNIPVGEHLGIVYEGSKEFNRKKKNSTLRDVFIQGSCDDGVLHLAKLFKWESDLEALIHRCDPELVLPQPAPPHCSDETRETPHTGTKNQKPLKPQGQDKNHENLKCDPTRAPLDRVTKVHEGTSVVDRAKNIWRCLTSNVLKPER